MSIEVRGSKVTGTVSGKTDYLLAGDRAGATLEAARALGVTILSEADFDRMVKEAGPPFRSRPAVDPWRALRGYARLPMA
jgi:BRCT domain type II-containing protein